MNTVEKFIKKAYEVAPAAADDMEAILNKYRTFEDFGRDQIDEVVFRESEYMGGMAVVILNLI